MAKFEKEIKQAVDHIPDLIMQDAANSPKETTPDNRHKILWGGVTVFAVIVFGMWYLNMSAIIKNFSHSLNSESKSVYTTTNDFQKILSDLSSAEKQTTEKNTDTEALKTKVQNIFKDSLVATVNATTTATATLRL